jgi:hypothetical protein
MKNNSETNWAKLDAITESEIDTSDIPPLTEKFFNKSRWLKPLAINDLKILASNPNLLRNSVQ